MNFTLGLLLRVYFFFIRSMGRRCTVSAKGRPDGRRRRRPEAAGEGAVRRPEAAGRPTGGYSGARAIGSSAPGPRAEPWPPSLIMRARSALTTCQLSAHAGRRRPPLRRAQRNTDVREKLTGCFTHDETEIQSYVQGVTGSISISTE